MVTMANNFLRYPLDFFQNCVILYLMKIKCEKCGAPVEMEYEAPFQEYPGAKVWGGTWYGECKCGWDKLTDQDLSSYSIRENTRGW